MLGIASMLESEPANRLDAHLDRTLLRIGRLERRKATQPAQLRARRQLAALGAEQSCEPAHAESLELRGGVVRHPAQNALELPQRDLFLRLASRDGVRLAREVRLETLAGDEEFTALLVEARVELLRQLSELFALREVGENRELRVRGAQRQLLAVQGEPRLQQRVLEGVLVLGGCGLDEALLAGHAQAVQPLTLVAFGQLLCLAERLELRAGEQIRVAARRSPPAPRPPSRRPGPRVLLRPRPR